MTIDPVELHARAAVWTRGHIAAVRDDQLQDPTPCAEWSVAALLDHLIGEQYRYAAALRGTDAMRSGSASGSAQPPAQAGRLAVYDAGVAALQVAARELGTAQRRVSVPIGELPGAVATLVAFTDTLLHGWDLATAVGRDATMPEDLAAAALAVCQQADMPALRGAQLFGPANRISAGAGAQDELLGYTGRTPA